MGTNVNLAQAIAAARAGKTAQAKIIVDRILQNDPNDENAWFLLSTLAETEEEQKSSLEKVLEIDPDHQAANARMNQLHQPAESVEPTDATEITMQPPAEVEEPAPEEEPVTPLTVSDESLDFLSQSEGDTVPAWMAEQDEGVLAAMPPAAVEEEPTETVEVPDWLREEPGQGTWDARDEGAVDKTRDDTRQQDTDAKPKAAAAGPGQSNLMLVVLIVLAVIVALALIYVLVAQPL